jgi:hypothetical protein
MPNHLINENSPYLLQHADNPVDWYPWGAQALEKARTEDKPIFLSIGYAACHWCHVMAHESFEDRATAAIMNDRFINIKVDREERPDLDGIYMSAVVAMTGQGGWPMSVFLTPDGVPFFGGTYFPPSRRYNMPSFREVLDGVHRAWMNDRPGILDSGARITQHLLQTNGISTSEQSLRLEFLDRAAFNLIQAYDWKHGGWGNAPKFPQPMAIEFLLRRASRGDSVARDVAKHALQAMAQGGMYDVIGGGFARYSTDSNWLVPHFEKMLYDNAQLALAYLHGFMVIGDPFFCQVCEETLDFMVRELRHPEGGLYSSLDADSEGHEGKYYLWTLSDLTCALPHPDDARLITDAYGITEAGNFEGATVLHRAMSEEDLAGRFNLTLADLQRRLASLRQLMLRYREQRIPPATDDKVLVSWNALALSAFAEAARYLRRDDYAKIAQQIGHFLLTQLAPEGRLLRSWRDGAARHPAYLEDHAALVMALLKLYQMDANVRWYQSANSLAEVMLTLFPHELGGFYDTGHDQDSLFIRPRDLQDNATPCGNSLAAFALLSMAEFNGNPEWRSHAESTIALIQTSAGRYPTAFGCWLQAADFALNPSRQIALLGDPTSLDTQALLAVIELAYRPDTSLARSPAPVPPGSPPLLDGRSLMDGRSTVYVCQNFVCHLPVTSPEALTLQLQEG